MFSNWSLCIFLIRYKLTPETEERIIDWKWWNNRITMTWNLVRSNYILEYIPFHSLLHFRLLKFYCSISDLTACIAYNLKISTIIKSQKLACYTCISLVKFAKGLCQNNVLKRRFFFWTSFSNASNPYTEIITYCCSLF